MPIVLSLARSCAGGSLCTERLCDRELLVSSFVLVALQLQVGSLSHGYPRRSGWLRNASRALPWSINRGSGVERLGLATWAGLSGRTITITSSC